MVPTPTSSPNQTEPKPFTFQNWPGEDSSGHSDVPTPTSSPDHPEPKPFMFQNWPDEDSSGHSAVPMPTSSPDPNVPLTEPDQMKDEAEAARQKEKLDMFWQKYKVPGNEAGLN